MLLNYSYFNAFTGSSLEAFLAGNIETRIVIIIEQIEIIKKIIDNGFAYESNGSIYFDLDEFRKEYKYGKLSGREIDELISNTRELTSQDDKRKPYDFALWKKADSKHLMKWTSPWGIGFPGWHIECTTMSHK